tara:strand:+ start:362 stop:700 length:339 start_codon:yes stop_codon:yes gene_type:complete
MEDTNFKPETSFTNSNSLEKMYGRLLRTTLMNIDDNDGYRDETYRVIIFELQKEYDYKTYDEIKYRITDGEDVNEVFYDIIQRGDYSSSVIWLMKERIECYIDEDKYKRFYR